MIAYIEFTADDAGDIIAHTFSGNRKPPAGMNPWLLAQDLNDALIRYRLVEKFLAAGLETKDNRRSMERLQVAFCALDRAFATIERNGQLSTTSTFLSKTDEAEPFEKAPDLELWLARGREYQLVLDHLLLELDELPKKKGRRFGSMNRFLVGVLLAQVYEKHFGKARSISGPWGRFVQSTCERLGISIPSSSADTSTRQTKKV